jgi:hypothetical protein
MAHPPPDPDPRRHPEDLACGREHGHDGEHRFYWTGFLARQDPRLVF